MSVDDDKQAVRDKVWRLLIGEADMLVAVWDGHGGIDKGGTAAVVVAARSRGMRVRVLWPDGARRG